MNEQIREQLKNYGGVPLSKEQKKSLMKISKKAFIVIGGFAAVWIFCGLYTNGTDFPMPVMVIPIIVWTVGVLLFELRDKIKLLRYDDIYIVPAYVESVMLPYRGMRKAQVQYYNFIMKMFCPAQITMDRGDDGFYSVQNGGIILTLMGRKGNVLKYFSVKPNKL